MKLTGRSCGTTTHGDATFDAESCDAFFWFHVDGGECHAGFCCVLLPIRETTSSSRRGRVFVKVFEQGKMISLAGFANS